MGEKLLMEAGMTQIQLPHWKTHSNTVGLDDSWNLEPCDSVYVLCNSAGREKFPIRLSSWESPLDSLVGLSLGPDVFTMFVNMGGALDILLF